MNARVQNALIGALVGGGLVGGLTAGRGIHAGRPVGETLSNSAKFGLIGSIPGAVIGALLSKAETPKNKIKQDYEVYFPYTPDLKYLYRRQLLPNPQDEK